MRMGDQGTPCPLCRGATQLVNGSVVYPNRDGVSGLMFLLCVKCEAVRPCDGKSFAANGAMEKYAKA